MSDLAKAISSAKSALSTEIEALNEVAKTLEANISPALEILFNCTGHVIITGIGKSGIVGSKMAATFASTGTPSFFVHSAEALHGDFGVITSGDVLIAISNSGETDEVITLATTAKSWGIKTIAITKNLNSTLAKIVDHCIFISYDREADPLDLAPTTSTTLTMVLGDTLASALMSYHGFSKNDFRRLHPGGTLGKTPESETTQNNS
jgi:arabinose-5-phosphate isomerase